VSVCVCVESRVMSIIRSIGCKGGLRRVEENGECHVDKICTRWEEEK